MTPNHRKAHQKKTGRISSAPRQASYLFIQSDEALRAYLENVQSAEWIAIDTEFISERHYCPELCLIQASAFAGSVLIDPLAIRDMTPFWEFLCSGILVIAHSCRSELEFCHRAIGRFPKRLFDVQLAAGFVTEGYPLNFKDITRTFLRINLPKGETRTDWHRRPLSLLQIEYALNDVICLNDLAVQLTEKMKRAERYDWFLEETDAYLNRIGESFGDNRWKQIGKKYSLSRSQLAVARELWRWREKKGQLLDRPVDRILKDEVLAELARRDTADPEEIALQRDLARRSDLGILLNELPAVIRQGMSLPESQLPELPVRKKIPNYDVAVHFLTIILSNYAHRQKLSLGLLGTPMDFREFLAHRQGVLPAGITPRLDTGWRKTFLNGLLDLVLDGHVAIKITDFTKNDPLGIIEL